MRRISHRFAGAYYAPKNWSFLPTVTPEESAELFRRQMERSREMLEKRTRIDVRAATEIAERGLEQCPRRDGSIIEPLHHRRLAHRSQTMFLPKATPVSEVDS